MKVFYIFEILKKINTYYKLYQIEQEKKRNDILLEKQKQLETEKQMRESKLEQQLKAKNDAVLDFNYTEDDFNTGLYIYFIYII
jgi:hypothetical protein